MLHFHSEDRLLNSLHRNDNAYCKNTYHRQRPRTFKQVVGFHIGIGITFLQKIASQISFRAEYLLVPPLKTFLAK